MTSEQINEIAGYIVLLTTFPAVATAVIYGLGSPWWTSWLGRVMFAKWLSVALVFLVIVARRTWGDYPGYEWVALIVYTFTLLTFTATTVELIIERRGPDDGSISPIPRRSPMTNPNATAPLAVPDIWYKAQRVLRTIVSSLIVLIPLVNGVAAAVIDYLQTQEDVVIPGWVFLWLNVVLVGTALIMGLVTRIMAVPGVNAWLTNLGLGSVPKAALVPVADATGRRSTYVEPDPKAETP